MSKALSPFHGVEKHEADRTPLTIDVNTMPHEAGSLDSFSAQIRDIQHSFKELTDGYLKKAVYKVVSIGLYLLKGESHFSLTAFGDNLSPKSRKRNELGQIQAQEGFVAWLEREHPDIDRKTSQRFRNAARHAGLTSDSTLADVEALRETKALHGKTLPDLYKALPAPGEPPAGNGPATATATLVQTTQLDLFATLDQVIVLRDQMEPEVYEATHLRLKATLEKLTGAKWVMLDEAPSIDADEEHGVVSGGNGKLSANDRARIMAEQKARWAKRGGSNGKSQRKGAKR